MTRPNPQASVVKVRSAFQAEAKAAIQSKNESIKQKARVKRARAEMVALRERSGL